MKLSLISTDWPTFVSPGIKCVVFGSYAILKKNDSTLPHTLNICFNNLEKLLLAL